MLARTLGFWDPDMMLALMPVHVYEGWLACWLAEPWDIPFELRARLKQPSKPVVSPAAQPLADAESRRMRAEVLLHKFKAQVTGPRIATA